MKMPVRTIIDWSKLEVCEKCADKIARELMKAVNAQRRGKEYNFDISAILCDECWIHNTEVTKAIRFELPPNMIRREGHGRKRKKAVA